MTTSASLPATAPVAGSEPDWDHLARHGLDRSPLELRFPLGADWHSLRRCRHTGCDRPATSWPWLCHRCASDWREAGALSDIDSWCASAPVPLARRTYAEHRCRVGCDRAAEVHGLCKSCASERRMLRLTVEEYLARGRALVRASGSAWSACARAWPWCGGVDYACPTRSSGPTRGRPTARRGR
ncbi:hypothetical protein ABZ079_14935 [Streptomyces sp. NPDC006314]|uniref:hypothetical protein n=1 Tax=Streptomyces sp. NPDC006314 TaxID=3154475 RepID=UPI0033AA32D6